MLAFICGVFGIEGLLHLDSRSDTAQSASAMFLPNLINALVCAMMEEAV